MGGWSGGVYTRFRNWVTDKANSVNPQASLFDQEDDGFAAGLNNCVTKDGLNKPSAAMDWNGQNLTGILNLANTGTISFVSAKFAIALNGSIISSPSAGVALTLNATSGNDVLLLNAPALADTTIEFDTNAVTKAHLAVAGNTSGVITGSAAGDLCARTQGGAFRISINSGAGTAVLLKATGALQNQDDSGSLFDTGWRDAPQRTVAVNTTLVASDRGKSIRTSTGCNITFPAKDTFSPGAIIIVFNSDSANTTLIAGTSDTMVLAATGTTGSRTLGQNGLATCYYGVSGFWYVSGPGVT